MDLVLQVMYVVVFWIVIWDDYEFDNNYVNVILEEVGIVKEVFLKCWVNVYQVYYEYMFLRKVSILCGLDMKLYWNVVFGWLFEFDVLDIWQY